jgi:hypothetical protein
MFVITSGLDHNNQGVATRQDTAIEKLHVTRLDQLTTHV